MTNEFFEAMTIVCDYCGSTMDWDITGDYLIFSCKDCEITEELLLDDLEYRPLEGAE